MDKINLNIKQIYKTIFVNDKEIRIPKLGLKHHAIIADGDSFEESSKKLLNTIHPNLSVAEKEIVSLHLLHYNGKINETTVIDGITYSINDVKICQKLRFTIGTTEFRFKSPKVEEPTVDLMLKSGCVSVKNNGKDLDIPDFGELPAFVYKWAEQITKSISLKTEKTEIKGLYKLLEIFDGNSSNRTINN